MTKEFIEAYNLLHPDEGYLANNKNDRGGMTWKGIARNMHPNWPGWGLIDNNIHKGIGFLKSNEQLEVLVKQFYIDEFWNKLRCQEIKKSSIRNKLFNTAVNVGIVPAVKFNQISVNLKDTGKVDDEFINNLNKVI